MLTLTHSRRIYTSCTRPYSENKTRPRANAAAGLMGAIPMLDYGAPALAGVNSRICSGIFAESVVWLQSRTATMLRPKRRHYARVRKIGAGAGMTVLMTIGAGHAATLPRTVEPIRVMRADVPQPSPDAALSPVPASNSAVEAVNPREAPEFLPASRAGMELAPLELPAASRLDGESQEAEQAIDLVRAAIEPVEKTFLQFDGIRVPRQLVEAILKAAEATSVDPVYMMALADKESSFIPDNKASSSSAEGLFQFVAGTWLEAVRRFGADHGLVAESAAIQSENGQLVIADETMREHVLGLRRDPYLSALMAAETLKHNRIRIEERIGRQITRSESYLAHFFGVEGATRFISLLDDRPKQSAPKLFPAAARANRTLFYARDGKKPRHLSVAEVYNRIDGMIDERLDRYADVRADSATVVSDADL
jgi:hypothetical protein